MGGTVNVDCFLLEESYVHVIMHMDIYVYIMSECYPLLFFFEQNSNSPHLFVQTVELSISPPYTPCSGDIVFKFLAHKDRVGL